MTTRTGMPRSTKIYPVTRAWAMRDRVVATIPRATPRIVPRPPTATANPPVMPGPWGGRGRFVLNTPTMSLHLLRVPIFDHAEQAAYEAGEHEVEKRHRHED